jgi:hypothetical protein
MAKYVKIGPFLRGGQRGMPFVGGAGLFLQRIRPPLTHNRVEGTLDIWRRF